MTSRLRLLIVALFVVGAALLFLLGGGSPATTATTQKVTVITAGATPVASATPGNPLTTVVAPPTASGTGATTDSCGVVPKSTTTAIVFFHGTNALTLCTTQVSHGWDPVTTNSTGSRSELCGMTDGTAASEDLIDVFDSTPYSDGVTLCHSLQSAGWGASAFWPVLEGMTPNPNGPGLPADYFG